MRPIYEKVISKPDSSISIENNILPYFVSQWHFHPEIEIILIKSGTGTLFIGSAMHRFRAGTLAIVGSNVPHVWLNDKEYYAGDKSLEAHSIVIKFDANLWGGEFAMLPEMKNINELLKRSSKGIYLFTGESNSRLAAAMNRTITETGMPRIISVLNILHIMSKTKDTIYLASSFEGMRSARTDNSKLDRVYKFLLENFSNDIKLSDIAALANMNASAFCRYFKAHTLKTLSDVINEIRIGYACKLLFESRLSISEIGYKSGYNSKSNFYKQFLKYRDMAPGDFRKKLFGS
jgi:AraC-like DNA-binding protein